VNDVVTVAGADFAEIDWQGRPTRIELAWVGASRASAPVIVFLHEGLGSVAMWKDFPDRLCTAVGRRGFVFSRPGYGRSTPRRAEEHWNADFMHRQAHDLLPRLLDAAGISRPWLFGHSDGASIALLYAARHPVAGVVALAPHLFVEDVSIASIEKARVAYETTDLRQRLARYHDDPDSAFRGWNDAWLSPAFRDWNIEQDVESVDAPVLAIQCEDDEYGTLEQIRAVARRIPGARLLAIADCGHSPHRDQPDVVVREASRFMTDR
jgi:pimeloyl-ACP methyl ester carboxylesterase